MTVPQYRPIQTVGVPRPAKPPYQGLFVEPPVLAGDPWDEDDQADAPGPTGERDAVR